MSTEASAAPEVSLALPGSWLRLDDPETRRTLEAVESSSVATHEESAAVADALRLLPQARAAGVAAVLSRIDPGRETIVALAWPAERAADADAIAALLGPDDRVAAQSLEHVEGWPLLRVPQADAPAGAGVLYWCADPRTGRLLSLSVRRAEGALTDSEARLYDALAARLTWEESDA